MWKSVGSDKRFSIMKWARKKKEKNNIESLDPTKWKEGKRKMKSCPKNKQEPKTKENEAMLIKPKLCGELLNLLLFKSL